MPRRIQVAAQADAAGAGRRARDEAAARIRRHGRDVVGVADLDPRRPRGLELAGERPRPARCPETSTSTRSRSPAKLSTRARSSARTPASPASVLESCSSSASSSSIVRQSSAVSRGLRHVRGHRIDSGHDLPQLVQQLLVRIGLPVSLIRIPLLGVQASLGAAAIPAVARRARSCSRHRPRVGPMLPMGMSSAALTSS